MDLAGALTALAAAFAGINGKAPYTTTVKNVNGKPTNMLASAEQRHAVDFIMLPFSESVEDIAESKIIVPLEVRGWVALNDAQRLAPAVSMAALWCDLRRAVKADYTLGGKVADSRWTTHRFEISETGDAVVVSLLELTLMDTL